MIDKIKQFKREQLSKVIKRQGKLVSDEQAKERIKICEGCEHYGDVEVPFIGEMKGCTICGCPLLTKAYMDSFWRVKENVENVLEAEKVFEVMEDKPLTLQELLKTATLRHLNPDDYELNKIKCPHPDGNKWAEIDNKY